MTKQEIRTAILQKRSELSDEDRALKNQLVFERAHKHRSFQIARTVHVYRSTNVEIDTMPFIEYAWAIGKEVYVPRVAPDGKNLLHCRIDRATLWESGPYGIPEPILTGDSVHVESESLFDASCAVVVPLVAFDRGCARLGYGKGFYDRFLRGTEATRIGIAYELQRVVSIPTEEHDVPLHAIATEERWYTPTEVIQ